MRHRNLPYLRRPVQIPRWAIATTVVLGVAVLGTAAFAAITPNYNAQCVVTPKSNGGQVLDCDPIAAPAPSTSPSASPSPSSSPTTPPSPTASPSPSTTPSPSPSTTAPATTPPASPSPTGPRTQCLKLPSRCGFPDDTNTGPNGLLPVSTRTTYTVANEKISNLQINGCVQVYASGVTFSNVFIKADGCFWGVRNNSTGLTIVDSEITCGGHNGTAVGSSNFTLTRVDIHNCENGLDVGSNVTMTDSWIHDMETDNGAHTDGVQIGQGSRNLVFRHNTITVPAPGGTSAIISWNEESPNQQNVAIDGNLLAGGTYTLYCPRQGSSDTRVTNNRFGNYQYGSTESCGSPHTSVWSGNVRDSDNAPVGR